MFHNHLKIAFRNLGKNRVYTGVTLFGLMVGIAAVLLIYRMISYELSFNKGFVNYDRIVRVVSETYISDGGESNTVCIPIPAMQVIKDRVSQFESVSFVREVWASLTVPNPQGGPPLKKFGLENQTALFATPEFLHIFDFQWLAGEPGEALHTPNGIVLTRSMAEKCFGDWKQALGQELLVDHLIPVKVTGVLEDLPTNHDFTFPYLLAYPLLQAHPDYFFYQEDWGSCSSNNQVYALLNRADQGAAANEVLAEVGKEEYLDQVTGKPGRKHVIQPLSDLHFSEEYQHSGSHRVSFSRLWVLGAIGCLILILACFNFINLTTAQASLRAKEVGVRKTLGGARHQLITQFLTETALIVLISLGLGVTLAQLASPVLSYMSDVPEELPFASDFSLWALLVGLAMVVTLLAGLYPSLVLARFKPVQALKNKQQTTAWGGVAIRRSLVVFQFAIALAISAGAIITLLQLDYIRSKDLGFAKDLVFTFDFGSDSSSIARQSTLKNQLLQIPQVESVSFSSDQPISGNTWATNFRFGNRPQDEEYSITLKYCDSDYQTTYGLPLLAGRWLQPSDTIREAVVNMTLLKRLGITHPQEVINEDLRLGSRRMLKIVGVVDDFHTHSLRQEHLPLIMTTNRRLYWEAGVKIRPQGLAETTQQIQMAFDEVMPEQIFSGDFLDEDIAAFYEDDDRLAAASKGFGILAILISCLGLFGLATHAASQRIKEIGIRKVLGASVVGIVSLLSKDFLKLVAFALIIGTPLAWYVMHIWLQDFVYRIEIQWWVFALVGIGAILVAFLTVSYQSIKAALANPVESLRSE